MKGFFTNIDHSTPLVEKLKTQPKPKVEKEPCEACGLYREVHSPKMKPRGRGRLGILLVGEAPGATEDLKGSQFEGDSGKILRDGLHRYDLDLERDFTRTNAVICRPSTPTGSNRTPSPKEIFCCHRNLQATLDLVKPRMVWLFGASALSSYFMDYDLDDKSVQLSTLRRLLLPDPIRKCWVVSLYHPSMVLRSHRPNEASIFDLDLRWAVSHFEKAPPVFPDYEKQVKVITSFPEALNLLSTIRDQAEITYDYETNCLKPYTSGAKILVVGVAFNEKAYSFPLYIWPDAQQDTFKEHWINILLNRKIKKVAHNIQFEELWNRVYLRIEKSQGWCADTMVTAHILDAERTHFCSLKTQAFVNFGVIGYEKDIKPLIPKKGMNSLDSLPPEKLGLYCGLDALFTHLLKKKQDIKIKNAGKEDINKVYLDGIGSMIDMTQEGMDVDQKFMFREKMRLATQITTGFNALMVDPIIKKFRDQFGRDPAIEMASDKLKIGSEDLKRIVYDVMKIPVTKTTAKAGKPSLDEEVLEGINHPFTKQIIFIRQRLKMKDTYLGQFERCSHEGKIHPTFNLHIARSGRSSSEDPNSQNFPARNEEAMNTVRGCLSAPPGWRIGEADHSGFEVRVIGVYSQDSVLINYIKDESTDMHRDCAEGLLLLPRDQITKDIRQIGKNGYVFPSFYGSYYVATARDIWKQLMYVKKSKEIFAHLKGKGIRNLQDFTNHVEQYERSFWKKFNGVKIWQEKTIKTYLRTGRIKYLTGFDRCGLLSNNQLLNTAIQGTAFQCLLWAIPRIAHRMRQEKMQSRIRGQIHDSILFLVKPGEEKQLQKIVLSIACKEIREYWSWLNIPLDMDFKFSEVGGSWAAMKKLDF